jgi:diguanylate cyclase (GGDEF)-like protein
MPNLLFADAEAHARRVLIVDEQANALRALTELLAGAGLGVEHARTAGEALEQIRHGEVEVVLMGDAVPGMSGLDLLRLLRSTWSPQQLPVIMMGPEAGDGELEAAAFEAGANDCLQSGSAEARALVRVQSQIRQRDAGLAARERAERIFRATAGATDIVWEWNLTTGRLWLSDEWRQLSGIARIPETLEEWMAQMHPEDRGMFRTSIHALTRTPDQQEFGEEYRLMTPGAEIHWIYCRANVERDRGGKLLRLTGLQTDITRNRNWDWLTQLPNRENILARADRMLTAEAGGAPPFALLLVNLDRFRVINESMGTAAGDRLLREIALRLERVTRTLPTGNRPADYLARIQGDVFLLILSDVRTMDTARAVANRLQAEICRPLTLVGREVRLTATLGIALSNADRYTQAAELLRDAEIALYQAKGQGRAQAAGFQPEMRHDAIRRLDMEIDLRRALEHEQFVLFYQPKIDIRTGALAGFEALMRWRHPTLGLVPPLKFIPIAEDTGLIVPMGSWAMEQSARQFAAWLRILPDTGLQMSVNLSVKQFFDRELLPQVERVVQDNSLPPGAFCLEVTESVLISEMQAAADILRRLHGAGVGLMIDDFGTGYSSLNYLTSLPFDALKIDRSFVSRLEEDENCGEVVKAVISLARTLKLDVVAEGVETLSQLERLNGVECPYAQGYYFAKPVDAAAATAMVRASIATL